MLFVTLAGLIAIGDPVVISREPVPAGDWYKAVHARCGRQGMVISDYGNTTRVGRKTNIAVNGRRITGSKVEQLLTDLSSRTAVHRITVLCSPDGAFHLRVYEGEAVGDEAGTARFRAGTASISGSKLLEYTGLRTVDANTFWFQ